MKFTNGQWVFRSYVDPMLPTAVYSWDKEPDGVTVYLPVKPVLARENTLDQGLLTLHFSSPREGVLTVRTTHHEGYLRRGPAFEVRDQGCPVEAGEKDGILTLKTGKLTAEIVTDGPYSVRYFWDGRFLTGSKPKGMTYITDRRDGKHYMRDQLSIGVREYVYGLGERFTPFVKNGQVVSVWNEDGGTSSEIAYKNIPFYVTSRKYGVFVNHPELVEFEVGSEQVEAVQCSVEGESLEYSIIGGDDLKQVLGAYTAMTGRPPVPPAWSYGLWLSTSFTTDYDEKTVMSFVDRMAEEEIPLRVFHFDCFWMKGFQWCDFEWDPDTFPDPQGMLGRLHEKGLKVCVWINPYIGQKSRLFREGMEKGYFIKNPDGSVWQWDHWQAGMAIVDFTNPEATAWYQSKLRGLMDMGVDCFKTDFGERIPTDVTYFDGSDPKKMHNYYTFLYNQAVYQVMMEHRQDGLLFARSATVGSQQFPIHWGGDCWGTYESMAESLRGGLSLCLSGFGYWSHDIGGFESTASPDLYKRWVAFGLMSSHSRLHGSHAYRVPWNFDQESCRVLAHFTRIKARMMPYLYAQSQKTAQEGVPLMRPMVLEYPDDPRCHTLDMQYGLGDNLIVAPIFNEEGLADFYLPQGTWTDILTGKTYEGGQFYQEHVDYFHIPVLAKAGSLIPFGSCSEKPDYDYTDGTVFALYAPEEGKTASAELYTQEGAFAGRVSVTCAGGVCTARAEGSLTCAKLVIVSGGAYGKAVDLDCSGGEISLRF